MKGKRKRPGNVSLGRFNFLAVNSEISRHLLAVFLGVLARMGDQTTA